MAKETYRARVAARRLSAATILQVELEVVEPPGFRFQAGQFVVVAVGDGILRSYSIASAPRDAGRLQIVVDLAARGPGSRFLERLRAGDPVSFQGPYGAFCLRQDTERELIFVATGTGIAPVRGMLLDLRDRGELERPIALFYGCRHRADLVFHEELLELARSFTAFAYHPTLSRPAPGEWAGMTGRVTAHIPRRVTRVEGATAFLCGSRAMLKDVSDILVGLGMDRRKIRTEQFF